MICPAARSPITNSQILCVAQSLTDFNLQNFYHQTFFVNANRPNSPEHRR